MAASRPVMVTEEVLKNELECPVCMEEPRLHLLPCAHRCCMPCVDRLAGVERRLKCPTCRKPATVPDQGFPVCVLTEHIKGILHDAREKEDDKSDKSQPKTHASVEASSNCEACAEDKVDVHCKNCHRFLCFRCSVRSRDCLGKQKQHNTELIEELYTKSQVLLKQWQQKTQDEVKELESEMAPLHNEKTTLHKEKVELEGKLNQVKQRMSCVEKSIKTKQRILDDKSSLLKASEIIESDGDVVELIRLAEQTCVSGGRKNFAAIKLAVSDKASSAIRPPTSLKFVSEHPTRNQCISVDHHSASGDILLGCDDGMEIYSRDSGEVRHVTNHLRARVVEYKGEVFISHHDHNKTVIKVMKYNIINKTITPIYSFPMKSSFASYLSVSEKFIASLDRDNDTLKLHNRRTEALETSTGILAGLFSRRQQQLENVTLKEFKQLINLCFLPDGTLLVTGIDESKRKLNKYRLGENPEKDITLIWTCDEVSQAGGIAVSKDGIILVSGAKNKTIYVVSSNGKLMKQFGELEKLPNFFEDISMRGDELAVAGWADKKLLLFKVVW